MTDIEILQIIVIFGLACFSFIMGRKVGRSQVNVALMKLLETLLKICKEEGVEITLNEKL